MGYHGFRLNLARFNMDILDQMNRYFWLLLTAWITVDISRHSDNNGDIIPQVNVMAQYQNGGLRSESGYENRTNRNKRRLACAIPAPSRYSSRILNWTPHWYVISPNGSFHATGAMFQVLLWDIKVVLASLNGTDVKGFSAIVGDNYLTISSPSFVYVIGWARTGQ